MFRVFPKFDTHVLKKENIAHCPDKFFSIMYITKLSMTSTACSSDVDPIKTTYLRVSMSIPGIPQQI